MLVYTEHGSWYVQDLHHQSADQCVHCISCRKADAILSTEGFALCGNLSPPFESIIDRDTYGATANSAPQTSMHIPLMTMCPTPLCFFQSEEKTLNSNKQKQKTLALKHE
jgi:hypothetical protein